jgi:catechol 2,3-dioxygenase-like lactoylglutathione lyase family enzyme
MVREFVRISFVTNYMLGSRRGATCRCCSEEVAVITRTAAITIPVTDQDQAVRFFVDVLGMEVRADEPMGPGARWIELAPPGAQTPIVPYTWFEQFGDRPGTYSRLVLECTDIAETYASLCEKGVSFEGPPFATPGGTFARFTDPFGNSFTLKEADKAAEEGTP